MVELSTGLFTDNEVEAGTWNGEDFVAIARNYRPDHLAILPDKVGACSIKDGAGLLRLNDEHALSHGDTRHMIWMLLRTMLTQDQDAFIEEVFDTFFVYGLDGKLLRQRYTVTNDIVSFEGDPDEVVRVTAFRTTTGEFVGNREESFPMDKKKFIDGLISNSTWDEEDREFLMGLPETRLKKMVINTTDKKKGGKITEPVVKPQTAVKQVAAAVIAAPVANLSIEQFIGNAPPAYRDMLVSGLRAHQAEKQALMAVITANTRNSFTPEQLNSMDTLTLKNLAALAQPEPVVNVDPIYAGLGDAFSNLGAGSQVEEPLDMPVMNFGPESVA